MNEPNQNPEQIARDRIDVMLRASGWVVQDKKAIDLNAGPGIAIREFQTDVGPVDYMLYVDRKPVGVIEAKREEKAQNITTVEEQSGEYAEAGAKFIPKDMPRRFVYESTGEITRFTDMGDPKPRSREVFTFHRPETLKERIDKGASLQSRLQGIPELDPTGLRKCQIIAIENLEASFKSNHPRALIQMAHLYAAKRLQMGPTWAPI